MFGFVALGGILLIVLCAIGALIAEAGLLDVMAEWNKPITLSIIRFTLWQATLSTLISVALAIPLSRALARRQHFFGRRAIIRLSSISFIIPSMVAILGIVAVHGRNGWINQLLSVFGVENINYLYGLGGILIAHVFFNLPLATRIFLNGLLTVPQHTWNLANLMGMKPRHIFRSIEWPLLRGLLPGVSGIVFLLCFTSFAIVLTLGGGPQSTTLEVAIYQAIRFDFNLPKAVTLSLIQIGICSLLALLFFASGKPFPLRPEDYPGVQRPDRDALAPRIVDTAIIAATAIFLLMPLVAVCLQTLPPFDGTDWTSGVEWTGWAIVLEAEFWDSLRWTLLIAIFAGLLSGVLALSIANTIVDLRGSKRYSNLKGGGGAGAGASAVVAELIGILTLLIPPISFGAGLFLFFHQFADALSLGPFLVVILNALLTLAFGIRILLPALLDQRNRYDNLCASLGIRGWNRWRYILWHALRHPIAYALAIATTLAAGDMGVIALFGTEDLHTLPLLMYRLIGNYRLPQAAVVALFLCALCFALFWLIEQIGRLHNHHLQTAGRGVNIAAATETETEAERSHA